MRAQVFYEVIQNGDIGKFFDHLNGDDDDDDDDDDQDEHWTEAQEEAYLYEKCYELYTAEAFAYSKLSTLQGRCVPNFIAPVSFRLQKPSIADHKLQKYTEIHCILISFCDDFKLDELAHHAVEESWQSNCDDACQGYR